MFVIYHDQVLKVHEFIHKPDGIWLDLGLGFYVKSDNVDILSMRADII